MKSFKSKFINTVGHAFNGTSWTFRGCEVVMDETGFACTCSKRAVYKCKHITSVELGILGVGQTFYNESIHT
jgi:hypothetical protein|tara:strand:+ start:2851 stop:3066 length:216 start_codon:yes stop_codon:yes gene_type:complete